MIGAADTLEVDREGGVRRKVDARRKDMFTWNLSVLYDVSRGRGSAPVHLCVLGEFAAFTANLFLKRSPCTASWRGGSQYGRCHRA